MKVENNVVDVNILLLHENAKMPTYGTEGAACFDLYAAESVPWSGLSAKVRTGVAFEIPKGYGLFIKPRSGLKFNHSIEAFSGTVDCDYRGEVVILLTASSEQWGIYAAKAGDRIAQAAILPVPRAVFTVVKSLSETARGCGGFGSTGV